MRISENFTLAEFCISQTAARNGIDMTPPPAVIHNLKWLVLEFMQPIRDAVCAPIAISSGYRPPELNKMIGGSKTSAHMDGRACDFRVFNMSPYETVALILDLELPAFDQVIHEFGRWVHFGIAEDPRGQVLTAKRESGRTVYIAGLEEVANGSIATV